MAAEFVMPKLGLTMEQGTITEWLVVDGAVVVAGDAIAVIETDKVTTEIESSGSGVIRFVGSPGATYDCGVLIGWICEAGEAAPNANAGGTFGRAVSDGGSGSTALVTASAANGAPSAPAAQSTGAAPSSHGRRFVSPNARRVAAELGIALDAVVGSGPDGRVVSEDVERVHLRAQHHPGSAAAVPASNTPASRAAASLASVPNAMPTHGDAPRATFAAAQLATMLGLDVAEVATIAPDGVVTRDDVAEHARTLIARARRIDAAAPGQRATGLTPMRRVIGQRMHASLQEMAQLTLTMDADMAVVVADRRRRAESGAAPGYTDYVIAAGAAALAHHRNLNVSMSSAGIVEHADIHVGMAVAVDGGLLVPVVRHADRLALAALSTETTRLAEAARSNRLAFSDLEGATFSVTALGMFGVDAFTPIVNPPNAAILGVGKLRDDVAWNGDALTKVTRLTLSLSWDHRVVDGAPAAEFTRTVCAILSDAAFWSAR